MGLIVDENVPLFLVARLSSLARDNVRVGGKLTVNVLKLNRDISTRICSKI